MVLLIKSIILMLVLTSCEHRNAPMSKNMIRFVMKLTRMFQGMSFPAIYFIVFLLGLPVKSEGQCKGFARQICRSELERFTHDGNYHAAVLTQGEEAELYKTFYSGQNYRIAICGSDGMTGIEFTVLDSQRNVLYNNRDKNYKSTWDFRMESSQQLMILVKVQPSGGGSEPVSGCVAILFGLSDP
jgi:hypothetical protein